MSCDCCCKNILPLCNVSICGDIDFGIKAQQEGEHVLELEFLNTQFTKTAMFEIGDEIKFSAYGLNENYTYQGKLFEPDGKQIIFRKDDVEYDCFSFQTQLSFTIAEPVEEES